MICFCTLESLLRLPLPPFPSPPLPSPSWALCSQPQLTGQACVFLSPFPALPWDPRPSVAPGPFPLMLPTSVLLCSWSVRPSGFPWFWRWRFPWALGCPVGVNVLSALVPSPVSPPCAPTFMLPCGCGFQVNVGRSAGQSPALGASFPQEPGVWQILNVVPCAVTVGPCCLSILSISCNDLKWKSI